MKLRIFILVFVYCAWQINGTRSEGINDKEDTSAREKDYLFPPPLVSPYGGTLKLLMGISVPVSLTAGRTMSFAANFQFQFPIPQNATFFTKYYDDPTRQRSRRSSDRNSLRSKSSRSIFYRYLEQTIDRWGGNGKECMLKSICEAAESPLKDDGLVGQLLHLVLTPEYETGNDVNATRDYGDYLGASLAGKTGENCTLTYPDCPKGFGLLDRVSKYDCTY